MSTRISHLMKALGLSQSAMAHILRCNQSTVSRLENGKPEQGLQAYVLDQLAREHGLDHLTTANFTASLPSPSGGAGVPLVRRVASGEGSAPREGGA